MLIADMEEEMSKGWWGGIRVAGERIWTLSYADDIVILAENQEQMEEAMRTLRRYLGKKGLQLSEEKTK